MSPRSEHPPWLTRRRIHIYIAIVIVALIGSGWGSDYQSCTRSAYWVGYFNLQAAALRQDARVAMDFAKANVTDPTKRRLDIEQARADLAQAARLRTRPLVCLHFPLPGTPRHGSHSLS